MDTRRNGSKPWRWRAVLAAALLLAGAPAGYAGELSLLINGKSIHFDEPATVNWNEKNWGAGLHYEYATINDKWVPFVTGSGFLDSNKNPSYYAGGGMMRRFPAGASSRDPHFDLGAVAFLMLREDFKDDKPFPGLLPVASVGTGPVALNVTYVPPVDPKSSALVFFQLKFTILEF
jgi:hypothetical protein